MIFCDLINSFPPLINSLNCSPQCATDNGFWRAKFWSVHYEMSLWTLQQLAIFSLISLAANFNYGFSTTYVNTSVDEFRVSVSNLQWKCHMAMFIVTTGVVLYYRRFWIRHLPVVMSSCQKESMTLSGTSSSTAGSSDSLQEFGSVRFSTTSSDEKVKQPESVQFNFFSSVGFLLGNFTAFIASVLQCLALFWYSPELLIVSRFVTSICMAVTYQSCILFLQECSPTHLRGKFSFLSEIFYSFMTMVGSFLGQDYILGDHLIWLCFFVVPFCFFFTLALLLLPETPKFLLIAKDQEEKALLSVKYYHGKDADAKQVLEDIRKEAQCESDQNSNTFQKMKELFTERHLRMALILSVAALQNTIGLWALLLSSTFFLEKASVELEIAQWSTTVMSLAYVSGTVTGAIIIERWGFKMKQRSESSWFQDRPSASPINLHFPQQHRSSYICVLRQTPIIDRPDQVRMSGFSYHLRLYLRVCCCVFNFFKSLFFQHWCRSDILVHLLRTGAPEA